MAMRRRSEVTLKTVVISLLALVTLLVYAVPSYAGLLPDDCWIALNEQVVVTTTTGTVDSRDYRLLRLTGREKAVRSFTDHPCAS